MGQDRGLLMWASPMGLWPGEVPGKRREQRQRRNPKTRAEKTRWKLGLELEKHVPGQFSRLEFQLVAAKSTGTGPGRGSPVTRSP